MPLVKKRWPKQNTRIGIAMAMIAPGLDEVGRRLVQPDEAVQADGDRVLVEVSGEVDERLEEVVPGEEEVEQGDGDDRRPGLRAR